MSEPEAHKTDNHGHDHSHGDHGHDHSHDAHGHDAHVHATAADIIPENSPQDSLLVVCSGIALLGLLYMMYVWMGIALPEIHEGGEGGHHTGTEQRVEMPAPEHTGHSDSEPATDAHTETTETNATPAPPPPPPAPTGESQSGQSSAAPASETTTTAPAPASEATSTTTTGEATTTTAPAPASESTPAAGH